MANQPTQPYSLSELKRLIGKEEHENNSFEKNNVGKYLVGHNFSESCISFCIVTDFSEFNYLYVSPNAEQITGHPVEKFERGGPEFWFTLVHPEELCSLRLIHQKIVTFFQALPREEKLAYCYCYDVRIRKASGEFIRLLCEFEGETLRPDDHLYIGKEIFTDVTCFDSNFRPTLLIRPKLKTSAMPEQVFHFEKPLKQQLTRREKEIYTLTEAGKTSKEISVELNISLHTVETHRRRICKKMRL